MKVLKTTMLVDKETGEILNPKDYTFVKEEIECKYIDIKKSNSYISLSLGNYFHIMYKEVLAMNLEPQYLIRFLKLCCYSNYDGILTEGTKKKKITEKDFEKILSLSKNETIRTRKYLLENKLIYKKDDYLLVNQDYIIKGKVKNSGIDIDMVRVFSQGYSNLYDSVKPRQHRLLVSFITLLPYVNVNFNTISKVQNTLKFEESEPFTNTEMAKICGYEKPSRFIKDLLSLKIDDTFAFIRVIRGDRDYFVVNPKIYYKGNDINSLQYIQKFFV